MILNASAFALPMEDESCHLICTSPPYWSLRKYSGLPPLVLGGEAKCEHEWGKEKIQSVAGGKAHGETGSWTNLGDTVPRIEKEISQGNFCQSCSAWRGDFGLEPTVELYIEHSMLVLRECWRVLRSDGVMFWNLGDSYARSQPGGGSVFDNGRTDGRKSYDADKVRGREKIITLSPGLKPKDLCLIPERFALAAQQPYRQCLTCKGEWHTMFWGIFHLPGKPTYYVCPQCEKIRIHKITQIGWYIRSRIVWAKPNPMPESVTDRPTSSHETIWMLTKSGKYWYDNEAVRQKLADTFLERCNHAVETGEKFIPEIHKNQNGVQSPMEILTRAAANVLARGSRNLRNVWEFPTSAFEGAHFATFPKELPRRCILAACPEKTCGKCGKGWVRILEKTPSENPTGYNGSKFNDGATAEVHPNIGQGLRFETKTLGWKPSCGCGSEETGKGICLDVFAGTFCTVEVAIRANRIGIGVELSKDYLKLGKKRLAPVEGQEMLI